jgi:hypothetical protein
MRQLRPSAGQSSSFPVVRCHSTHTGALGAANKAVQAVNFSALRRSNSSSPSLEIRPLCVFPGQGAYFQGAADAPLSQLVYVSRNWGFTPFPKDVFQEGRTGSIEWRGACALLLGQPRAGAWRLDVALHPSRTKSTLALALYPPYSVHTLYWPSMRSLACLQINFLAAA